MSRIFYPKLTTRQALAIGALCCDTLAAGESDRRSRAELLAARDMLKSALKSAKGTTIPTSPKKPISAS